MSCLDSAVRGGMNCTTECWHWQVSTSSPRDSLGHVFVFVFV
jgi:hypothetical protein